MAIQDNSPVLFYFTTKAQYDYMEHEDNAIYYITDTGELMIGNNPLVIESLKSLSILNDPSTRYDATNKGYVDTAIANHKIDVDSELDSESENPVQNKVVTGALSGKLSTSSSIWNYGSLYRCSPYGNFVLKQKSGSFTDPDDNYTYPKGYYDTRIRNLIDPVLDGDAVPKSYVDTKIGDINQVLASLTQV